MKTSALLVASLLLIGAIAVTPSASAIDCSQSPNVVRATCDTAQAAIDNYLPILVCILFDEGPANWGKCL